MYVKVLTRDSDRVDIFTGVQSVQFLADIRGEKAQELSRRIGSGEATIGNLRITCDGGKTVEIALTDVAFLCNEFGKAVERFSARGDVEIEGP